MKRGLLIAPILIVAGFVVAGIFSPPRNFAKSSPGDAVLSGNESAVEILSQGQQFMKNAKSTSLQADYIIEAIQKGERIPLFPAEFRLKYSATLDKYLYEVTSPAIAVGSAMLINRQPSLVAKNSSQSGLFQNVSLTRETAAVEVADGCSGSVCSVDGSTCGDCSGAEVSGKTTFQTLVNSSAFDLPFLSDFSNGNSEKVQTVSIDGEMSTVVRFDKAQALALGFGDILVTVRHRDGAPIAFDFIDTAGLTAKHMKASYVGLEMTSLTAIDNVQNLELHITLKSLDSVNRNVQFSDSIFTRENLVKIVGKSAMMVAE